MKKRAATHRPTTVNPDKDDLIDLLQEAGLSANMLAQKDNCYVSRETIMQAMNGSGISTWALFQILHALQPTRPRMISTLQNAGDTILYPYLVRKSHEHQDDEITTMFKRLTAKMPEKTKAGLSSYIEMLGEVLSVDVSKGLAKIKENF